MTTIESDKHSLAVVPDGPIRLLDHHPIDQLTQRNRERVPERQPPAESRAALARLAGEQAALKRVAILVARGTPSEQVFAAVTEEVGRLLCADMTHMCRYEPDNTMTFVATWTKDDEGIHLGSRWPLGGQNLATLVFETGRSVRIDSYADASGPLGVAAQDTGIRSAVASPIIVEGQLWGMMGAGLSIEQALPGDSEARLASFTELVAMAIANAESRAELKASRARIITATDETRLRIERDLHDGIQQQLVSLLLELRSAEATVPSEMEELRAHQARMKRGLDSVLTELQEISRGIHPAILTKAGLGPALEDAGTSFRTSGRARTALPTASARARRGRGVLRGFGGAHQRGQACACVGGQDRRSRAGRDLEAGDPRRRSWGCRSQPGDRTGGAGRSHRSAGWTARDR